MNKAAALLKSGVGAARYRLTGHRMPLSVTLSVTNRCNALCATCAIPLRPARELDTRELIALVDALAAAGTVRVCLTGGEPLVRDDIGLVVDRCAAHGMWTTMESNGYLYPARAHELTRLGRLMIALDGDEASHDANREPGAWRLAMAAIGEARRRGVDVHTITTLTRRSLDTLDAVLSVAEEQGFIADFQLLQAGPMLSAARHAALSPPDAALKKALRWLLEARLAGRPVGTTDKYLRYALTWKEYGRTRSDAPHEDLHCVAGQLYCAVDAAGVVTPCPLLVGRFDGGGVREHGFGPAFARLRDNTCQACTSTSLTEYNYLYNLNAPALFEWAKSLRTPAAGAVARSPGGAA